MNDKFEAAVHLQVALLNAGNPLEAFDAHFAADGMMYSNGVVFAKGAQEAREKQVPFIRGAAAISGLITDLKTHAPTQTCVFRNKSCFRTHGGQDRQIDGLCWQLWQEGRIVEERYYDGDAMLNIISKGVLLNPEMLVERDAPC